MSESDDETRATVSDEKVDRGHPDVPGYRYDRFPSTSAPEMAVYVDPAEDTTSLFEGKGDLYVTADDEVIASFYFDNTADEEELHFPQVSRHARGYVWGHYNAVTDDSDDGEGNTTDGTGDAPDGADGLEIAFVMTNDETTLDVLESHFRVYRRESWAIGLYADTDDVQAEIDRRGLTARTVTTKTVSPDAAAENSLSDDSPTDDEPVVLGADDDDDQPDRIQPDGGDAEAASFM